MERLTRRIDGVVVYVGAKNPYSTGQIPCEVEPAGVREMMDRLAAYEDTGLTPELVRETAELAIWVHDNGIEKIKEWIKADKDGRLVVRPFARGRTLLCEENIDSLQLMKDVELAIRYCSSCGIVFYMGYNVFCDLVKHGRITAVSDETEKALKAMKDE